MSSTLALRTSPLPCPNNNTQVTYSRLVQERREQGPAAAAFSANPSAIGGGAALATGGARDGARLALELAGALERCVGHAAEGLPDRPPLPQSVLAFFAANRKVRKVTSEVAYCTTLLVQYTAYSL